MTTPGFVTEPGERLWAMAGGDCLCAPLRSANGGVCVSGGVGWGGRAVAAAVSYLVITGGHLRFRPGARLSPLDSEIASPSHAGHQSSDFRGVPHSTAA